jgi:hypothetical protein
MAKPFEERFAAMLGTRARAADVDALIAEAQQLEAQALAIADAASERAADPLSTIEDARAAKVETDQAHFALTRLQGQIAKLRERFAELTSTDQAQAKVAEYEAAAAENAALATEIAETYPRIVAELVDLFSRLEAHETRIGNLSYPGGRPSLISPEAVARGCNSVFLWGGVSPVERLTAIKLPRLDGPGRTWPTHADKHSAAMGRLAEATRTQLLHYEEEKRQKLEARERRFATLARYKVTAPKSRDEFFTPTIALEHAGGQAILARGSRPATIPCEMFADQAEAAKAQGFKVEKQDAREKISAPSISVTF